MQGEDVAKKVILTGIIILYDSILAKSSDYGEIQSIYNRQLVESFPYNVTKKYEFFKPWLKRLISLDCDYEG